MLNNFGQFSVLIDGQAIAIRNVGVDPSSHGSHYLYSGGVSAYAGQVANLRIVDNSPNAGGVSNDLLVIDEIRLLPIPEPPPVT